MSSGTGFWKELELLCSRSHNCGPKIESLARGEENKQILGRAAVGSGIRPRFTPAEQGSVRQRKDTAELAVRPKWRSGRAGG